MPPMPPRPTLAALRALPLRALPLPLALLASTTSLCALPGCLARHFSCILTNVRTNRATRCCCREDADADESRRHSNRLDGEAPSGRVWKTRRRLLSLPPSLPLQPWLPSPLSPHPPSTAHHSPSGTRRSPTPRAEWSTCARPVSPPISTRSARIAVLGGIPIGRYCGH